MSPPPSRSDSPLPPLLILLALLAAGIAEGNQERLMSLSNSKSHPSLLCRNIMGRAGKSRTGCRQGSDKTGSPSALTGTA